jgi:hypothetical protein
MYDTMIMLTVKLPLVFSAATLVCLIFRKDSGHGW